MSFWSDLGNKAKDGVVGAWDATRSAGEMVQKYVPMARLGTSIGEVVQKPLMAIADQASHTWAWSTALVNVVGDSSPSGYLSMKNWDAAWKASEGTSGGSTLAYNATVFANPNKAPAFTAQGPSEDLQNFKRSTGGRLAGGAMDVVATWYADPTIAIGGAAKLSRAANTIEDAAKAEDVSKAFDAKGLAANPAGRQNPVSAFSTSTDETASRLSRTIARTDNMDTNEIAAHMKPLLERSANAAPIVDLLGQAGKVTDLTLQRQIKSDILLAAAGSETAKARLIESAPAIAKAMQNASTAPAEFARLDAMAATADSLYARGDSLTAAARALGEDTGRKAAIVTYGKTLDRVHRHMRDVVAEADMGGLERVGLTALDKWKASARSRVAQEFYYQEGSSGVGTRVLHWSTSQRSRGLIATDDAFRGHSELMDHLTRSGLYSGAERAKISEQWWKANGQGFRNARVDKVADDLLRRQAERQGMTQAEVQDMLGQAAEIRASGRKYATAQLEKARAEGASRVTIEDPHTGTPTQVDRALYESHVRNNVALPDTQQLDRMIRHFKDEKSLKDRGLDGGRVLLDTISPLHEFWRLAVLARPGLLFRTQLDTQARSVAMMGATAVIHNALTGAGHKIGEKLGREDLVKVGARAQDDLMRQQALAEAKELRRKADMVGANDAGTKMHSRADELEAYANRPVEYDAANHYMGTKDVKVKVAGTTQTTRAYQSYDDMLAQWNNLLPGDASMGDLFTGLTDHQKAKFIENSDNWKTYDPKDSKWAQGWVRATDAIRTSYTGRKVLSMADTQNVDLVKSLREDPRVKKEWLDVKFDNPQFDDWLDRVIYHSSWYAPTPQIRKAILSGKRLDEKAVDQFFVGAGESTTATWQAARDAAGKETLKVKRELLAHVNKKASTDPDILAKRAEKQRKLEGRLAAAKAKVDQLEAGKPVPDATGKADRMFVHGPEFQSVFDVKNNGWSVNNGLRWMIHKVSDTPDVVLARHPLYVNRYMNHFESLAKRAVERGEVDGTLKLTADAQKRIESVARHRAIKDVQQTMYDTARYTGAHAGVMRIVSPFLNAWEDAMMSWSRLMYDDPKRLGALVKTWNAPERMNLVIDQDGNVVKPGQAAQQKFIAVPLGAASKFVGVKELQLRKDSWNSIFQGEVWWQPGYGPLVTVPAQEIVTRAFPTLPDTAPEPLKPFIRGLLNGDAPKVRPGVKGAAQDLAIQLMPSWLQKGVAAFDPSSPAFTNVFQDSVNSQVIEMRKAGHEPTRADWTKIQDKAVAASKATTIVKSLALGLFGMSSEGAGIQKFYSDQYNALYAQADQFAKEGKTVEQVFNERYPEAAGLRWNVSVSDTGIAATVKTEDRAAKFKKDIQNADTREYGWAYIGSDNVGGEWSPSIYNAQSSRSAGPGSTETQRRRVSPEEMVTRTKVDLGWGEYQRIATKIDLILESRGLNSTNQKGAEDLAAIKRQFVAQLSADNPQWAKDYGSFDSNKMQRFIDNFAKPELADPRMKDRPDIKLMGQYLDYRQKALDVAKSRGLSSLNGEGAADLRDILAEAGAEFARQDLGFEQMWNRMLSREVDQ